MTLRTSLQRLIGRDPARLSLRERAAETAARLAASKPAADAAPANPPTQPRPDAALTEAAAEPDPILPLIEEGRRLLSASREAFKLPDIGLDPHPDREAAQDDLWAHFRGPVCTTQPTTFRGCVALAQYAVEFREFQGVDIGDELLLILSSIACSPLLDITTRIETPRRSLPAPDSPEAPTRLEPADEILARIDAHHAAFSTWDAAATAVGISPGADPDLKEARKATIPLLHDEEQAFMTLVGSLPTSLSGLMALADYLPGALALRGAHEADDEAALALGAICAGIRALVAKGKVVAGGGALAGGANPDPVSGTLTADILQHWPVWAAEQRYEDTPAAERVEARRFALIQAAEVLPATQEAIVPKALALAWLDYVDNWRAGWTRDDYTTDGRLVLDIHAALMEAPAREQTVRPATPTFDRSISDRIDFAAATLNELVAIYDTAKLVGEVAQAVVWQGRCKAPSARNPYASTYNAAGELMAWLSDELIHVEHLAYAEMKKRQPADRWDRERRLAWIAAPIIQNGDTNETAAFIGELAAFMADEAKG